MTIAGMSCGHCIAAVRRSLEALPGVRVDAVSVGSASVTFDPSQVTTDRLASALAEQGYEVAADR